MRRSRYPTNGISSFELDNSASLGFPMATRDASRLVDRQSARIGLMVLRIAVVCLVAATALGCASFSAPLTCPERGGAAWIKITSHHFILKTDLTESVARDQLEAFERSYQVLDQLAFPSRDPPSGRIDVVVFSRIEDYEEIAPSRTAGFFTTFDLDRRPLIVMRGQYSDATRRIFQHELTHRFVRQLMPRAPRWLHEGLAEFYETLEIEEGEVVIGAASSKRTFANGVLMARTWAGWMAVGELPSATQLLDAPPAVFDDLRRADVYYAGSWFFLKMLVHGPERYERRFMSFLDELKKGRSAKDAWRDSFSSVPNSELDEALATFRRTGEVVVERAQFSPRPISIASARPMSDDEVHILWAQLKIPARNHGLQPAKEELKEVLARSPRSAEAHHWSGLVALHLGRFREAEAHFRDAIAVAPYEERYLQALCRAIYEQEMARSPGERKLARLDEPMHRLAMRARSAAAFEALGWYLAALDRPDEGWPLAERSVQLDPSCAECLDTLALLAFKKGRVHKAIELQRQAVTLIAASEAAQLFLDRLRLYERAAVDADPRF